MFASAYFVLLPMHFLSLLTLVALALAARPLNHGNEIATPHSHDSAVSQYTENLLLRPLPRSKVLASFAFHSELPPLPLLYNQTDRVPRHYGAFPRALEPVLASTNTRELHLRFTQGWWDSDAWGALPANGSHSGGTGVELWAAIEAASPAEAMQNWVRLAELLLGFFCASLNFVTEATTTRPRHATGGGFVANSTNSLYVMRAALPDEPICTENLTPFLKMLPTRGKAGVALLLDGHSVYDALWHSMGVDLMTKCTEGSCNLVLDQYIHALVDIERLLRRRTEGGIPKPIPGDRLRCDPAKHHDAWHCFPSAANLSVEWDVASLFGRPIRGAAFEGGLGSSTVSFDLDRSHWDVQVLSPGDISLSEDATTFSLTKPDDYNFHLSTHNSSATSPIPAPPVRVSRSLTGYSQDKGGMRVRVKNPTSKPVSVVYFDALPWFMRVYLHTLQVSGSGQVRSQFYKPAIDRKRLGHFELEFELPAFGDLTFTYDFDKSLLLYAEYPPDANHGFSIAPAVVKVVENNENVYEMRTNSLLLTLPTPDFSMPYNVIILTCTVMSLAFGTVFNLLSKKVVTEAELEEAAKKSAIGRFKARVLALKAKVKAKKA